MSVNYATQYSQALSQSFPNVLHFGALYNTPNNGRYRIVNANTIEIPSIETTGRVDSDRDTIATAKRNWSNRWEPKKLENQRKWSTLVHPQDINQTNAVATIQNITTVFNQEHKFPEMDSYAISKIHADWVSTGKTADTDVLTADTILSKFDAYMEAMDEHNVPKSGRILYVTSATNTILKNAKEMMRTIAIDKAGATAINRNISRIDEVEVISVPSSVMKTVYDFTVGAKVGVGAKQINMVLIHPLCVITPVSYAFAKLDEPSAGSEGKYIYYEESHEDVFILNSKVNGIMFNVT